MSFRIRYFNSDSELEAHIQSPYYGINETFATVCFGVSITKMKETHGEYEYKIRFNITGQTRDMYGTRYLRTNKFAK